MQIRQLLFKALKIRAKYSELEMKKFGKEWSNLDLANGFLRDVKDLLKLIKGKDGGKIPNLDKKLAHELSDCLWSVLILSEKYGIDIEKNFMESMNELEHRIEKEIEKS